MFFHNIKVAKVKWRESCKRGQGAFHGTPCKNPEIGNLSIFRIWTLNLVSKVLY
jgi:hypothetical protein